MEKLGRKFKFLVLCSIFVCTLSFVSFADTVEIKMGIKTTFASQPIRVVATKDMQYDLKWAIDKRGDWKLYIRKINGRLVGLSNMWVSIPRTVINDYGVEEEVVDWYYFDHYEKMVTGWYVDLNGDTYFLSTDDKELGKMARGWCVIGGDYYYFNSVGILQRNTITADGFYVDETGKWR